MRRGLKRFNLIAEEILRSMEDRNLARKEKNYKKPDEIRKGLLSRGNCIRGYAI
jgi:cysteinyl-tRNA synthetase